MTTYPIQVNAWQRDAAVSFNGTGISESIILRPSSGAADPAAYADTLHATALARRADGQRAVFRPWFNLDWGDQPRPFYSPDDRNDPNAWPNILEPFESPALSATTLAWFDTFNARVISNGTKPDYVMLDNEDRASFYYHADQAARQAYYTPVTAEGYSNPALADASVYQGKAIWDYATPETDFFIQEHEQSSYDRMTAVLTRYHLGIFSAPQLAQWQIEYETRFGALPEGELVIALISNYNDMVASFSYGEARNRPNRLPYPQTRIAHISAPIAYINRRDLPQFQAEPEYTTARQIANRQRFKSVMNRQNAVRSSLAVVPGEVHPWIQAPGWGWDGTEAWANATRLPFELLLWRVSQAHLEAAGVSDYNLWNPIPSTPGSNDPNSATTHAFMAAYFTGRTVGPAVRDLPLIDLSADSFTTGGVTTNYADLFEITTLYFKRSPDNPVAFMRGLGTEADPLVISDGTTGDDELAAMVAAIEINQATEITTEEVGEPAMSVTLVKQGTTDAVDDPTLIEGQIGDELTLTVALRNTSGGAINGFAFVEGEGVTAAWAGETPPISIANNQQQNIVLTFDDTQARDNFDTTFQVTTSSDDPTMNIRLNIAAPPTAQPGASRTVISQRFPTARLL